MDPPAAFQTAFEYKLQVLFFISRNILNLKDINLCTSIISNFKMLLRISHFLYFLIIQSTKFTGMTERISKLDTRQ